MRASLLTGTTSLTPTALHESSRFQHPQGKVWCGLAGSSSRALLEGRGFSRRVSLLVSFWRRLTCLRQEVPSRRVGNKIKRRGTLSFLRLTPDSSEGASAAGIGTRSLPEQTTASRGTWRFVATAGHPATGSWGGHGTIYVAGTESKDSKKRPGANVCHQEERGRRLPRTRPNVLHGNSPLLLLQECVSPPPSPRALGLQCFHVVCRPAVREQTQPQRPPVSLSPRTPPWLNHEPRAFPSCRSPRHSLARSTHICPVRPLCRGRS